MEHTINFEEKVQPLRDEIDRIDSDILSLLARRQEQVKQVVALKKACRVPIYHPAREENLISRLRGQAVDNGMDPDIIEDLFRVIIRQSRVNQTRQMHHKGARPGARVVVVGGAGRMGRVFARLFDQSGYQVRILEATDWDRAPELCRDCDLALVSVPIEKTVGVIERLTPLLPKQALLADLTSIKEAPVAAMCRCHPGPVLGIHPLFGPTTTSLDRQIIGITPGRDPDAAGWLTEQLSLWGAVLVSSTPASHDRVMDIVQALRHFATFCFGRFLFDKQVDIHQTLEFSSPIYRLELGMVGRLFAQDAGLYARIVFATPERRQLLADFVHSMARHLPMLEENDTAAFIDQFQEIAAWFGPFSDQALRESTFLIDRLIERF